MSNPKSNPDKSGENPKSSRLKDFRAEFDTAWEKFRATEVRRDRLLKGANFIYKTTRRAKFKDEATERRFNEKENRLYTAMSLGVPDRVPVITNGLSFYPAHYAGITFADFCNDRRKCRAAYLKFARENTEFDMMFPAHMVNIGRLVRLSQVDFIKLPGIHLEENVSYQFVEKERLKPEEYPRLIEEGYEFFRRVLMPRISPLYHSKKGWGVKLLVLLIGELISFARFYNGILNTVEREYGLPVDSSAMFFEPYDLAAILFRGLTGISMDLFRYPKEVEDVTDMLAPLVTTIYKNLIVGTGLRGAVILCERAFSLSPKQFARFSLPTLKRVSEELIARGMMPIITLEGNCTHLFESMLDLPRGKFLLNIDTGDIFKAKKILDGHVCLAGNVPMNMMVAGTVKDIREYCKRLIAEVAPGGGYVMSGALGIPDNAKPENVRAMVEYTIENGKY